MKLKQVLKLLWREIISVEEQKLSFFHGVEKLINEKRYDQLFRMGKNQDVEMIFYDTGRDLLTLKTREGVVIETNRDYGTFLEVFIKKIYTLPPQIKKEFCVFDVGMNRGYASLFFANYSNCKEIFGFELDPKTFDWALRNFALNPDLASKITPFCFGLWNEDKEIEFRLKEFDGCTAVDSLLTEYPNVKKMFENEKSEVGKAKVKKADKVISELLKNIPTERMKILKIDIEGSEYVVFEDLHNHNILDEFDLIIGECHNGIERLEKYLQNFNLIYKSKNQGLVLMFAYLHKRVPL